MRTVRTDGRWNGLAASLLSGYRHLSVRSMTSYRHDIIVALCRPLAHFHPSRGAVRRLSGCCANPVMIVAAFSLTLGLVSAESARAAQNAWIVTHSRETLVEATDLGNSMQGSVELPVRICRAKNGKYFAALGPGSSSRLKKLRTQYVASGVIPSDAFITQTCYPVEESRVSNEPPTPPLSVQVTLLCQTIVRCSVVKGSNGTFYPCNGAPDYAEKIYVVLTPSLNSATITDASGQITDFDLQSSEDGYHLEGGSYGFGVYDINRLSGKYSGMRLIRKDSGTIMFRREGQCQIQRDVSR